MVNETTTITISKTTRAMIELFRSHKRDTIDDIIVKVLDDYDTLKK